MKGCLCALLIALAAPAAWSLDWESAFSQEAFSSGIILVRSRFIRNRGSSPLSGEQIDDLIDMTVDADWMMRVNAIRRLGAYSARSKVRDALLRIARNGETVDERAAAVRALRGAMSIHTGVRDDVEDWTRDPEARVQMAAISVLSDFLALEPDYRDLFMDIAQDRSEEPMVRIGAIRGLRRISSDPGIRDDIWKLCKDQSDEAMVRSAACGYR